ncbi:MAG: Gldg family protein [Clostridiales bacterium]|nr:Gldg family protein [Candidatus Coliplasma equi]
MAKIKTVRDARRYKYGSISVLFTVAFVALIIILNAVLTSLSLKGDLNVDLTKEDFTSVGDESYKLLSELGKDLDITIYFMSPRDVFDYNGEVESNMGENQKGGINLAVLVRDLAENYAKTFDGSGELGTVRVEYKELNTDPEFEKKYYEESTNALTSSSIIIQGKYHFRILQLRALFVVNENNQIAAFNGENRLTTAMLQSSISAPEVVSLTYGHGEPISGDGTISTASKAFPLVTMLTSAGFEIKPVNLAFEELDERTEIVISYDPVTDFSANELDKISDHLKGKNSFIAFVDNSTADLPNLRDFLSVNWGIDYKPFACVSDEKHSFGSYDIVSAKLPTFTDEDTDGSAAATIVNTVISEGRINTAMPNSVALSKRDTLTKDDFIVENVLTTYDSAIVKEGENISENAEVPLMLLSTRHSYGKNNVLEYEYVMLVGSTDFATITDDSFGNKRVLLGIARVFSANRVALDIDYKEFVSSGLEIELGEARTLTWVICTVLPGALFILGIVVYFRRRHL